MSTKTPEQRVEERIASEQYWATPEGRAVKRWPADKSMDGRTNLTLTKRNIRQGYATCIREEVEPRDRLLQELVNALGEVASFNKTAGVLNPSMTMYATEDTAIKALTNAKEKFGITPTP